MVNADITNTGIDTYHLLPFKVPGMSDSIPATHMESESEHEDAQNEGLLPTQKTDTQQTCVVA